MASGWLGVAVTWKCKWQMENGQLAAGESQNHPRGGYSGCVATKHRRRCLARLQGAHETIQWSFRLYNGQAGHWIEMPLVESGHLAAALKRGGGDNQVVIAGHLSRGFQFGPNASVPISGLLRVGNYWQNGNSALLPFIPRSGEPPPSGGEVFMPGSRFLHGKPCFVHCFRQVLPGANSLTFRHQPGNRLSILQQRKGRVLMMRPVHTVGKVPGCLRNGDRRFLHSIRLSGFIDISIRDAN